MVVGAVVVPDGGVGDAGGGTSGAVEIAGVCVASEVLASIRGLAGGPPFNWLLTIMGMQWAHAVNDARAIKWEWSS
jgi:hypothetical protein